MIEFKTERRIVSFDGRVLEMFGPSGTYGAWHYAYLESAEIYANRKGTRQFIRFNFNSYGDITPFTNPEIMPDEMPQAQALVDAVNKAIASR